MKVVDPGHVYVLDELDDPTPEVGPSAWLIFVKRVGEQYPGNVAPAHSGVTTQEVLRALIDRTKYVDGQKPHPRNKDVLIHLRDALTLLEMRAAEERGESLPLSLYTLDVEGEPTCRTCGHIRCTRHT